MVVNKDWAIDIAESGLISLNEAVIGTHNFDKALSASPFYKITNKSSVLNLRKVQNKFERKNSNQQNYINSELNQKNPLKFSWHRFYKSDFGRTEDDVIPWSSCRRNWRGSPGSSPADPDRPRSRSASRYSWSEQILQRKKSLGNRVKMSEHHVTHKRAE